MDEAIRNGLNSITNYVMWSVHQPIPGKEIVWDFIKCVDCDATNKKAPLKHSCDLSHSSAIRLAAERGLFAHLRVGPYDCAEFSHGGIPEWLPLYKPQMAMRKPNREWMQTMERFVTDMIEYISENKLWVYQDGPVLGQI